MPATTTAILNALKTNPPQRVKIKVSPTTGSEFYLTEEQIVQNSCTVDRYVVTGDKIAFGTACAAELNFKIKNKSFVYNGVTYNPDDIKFEGARVKVWCVIDDLTGTEREIPMGVFTIDEQPRKLSTISLVALDDMVKLDKACEHETLPTGSAGFISLFNAANTGVSLSTNFTTVLARVYSNYTSLSTGIPLTSDSEELSWRQLMSWFAELAGGNLLINADGKLDILFFSTSNVLSIDESMRYSSDIEEQYIRPTGITVTLNEEKITAGNKGYEYNISGNKLIIDAKTIEEMDGFLTGGTGSLTNVLVPYKPFKATIKSFPNLWPMDYIVLRKNNTIDTSILTHVTWTMNGAMAVESAGLNSTRNGYASNRALTSAEKAIIDRISKNTNDKISDFEQAVIDLNNKVKDTGKGLYHTEVTDENGAIVYYTHDTPNLDETTTYITMTSTAGFVFTYGNNCWNEGNPVWLYGYTDYGDMVMNTIAARKISTELLTIGGANRNLLANGGFDDDLTGWNQATSTYQDSLGVWQYPFYECKRYYHPDDKSKNVYLRLMANNTTTPHLDSEQIAVEAGKVYTVSFKVRCNVATIKPRIEVDVYNDLNQNILSVVRPQTSDTTTFNSFVKADSTYAHYSFDFTVPSVNESCYAILRIYISGVSPLYYADFDDILLRRKDSGNVCITEDEISVYNGKITIYSDSSGGKPVFSANEDGTLKILGDLRAEGSNYDMICANVTYNSDSVDIDSQGLFQVAKGAEIPNSLTDIQTIPYIRFVDEITSDVMKRNLEINSLNDINIISQNSNGAVNIKALQIAAGTAVLNIGNINCTGTLWGYDPAAYDYVNRKYGCTCTNVVEAISYLIDRYNNLWKRVTGIEAEDPGYIT